MSFGSPFFEIRMLPGFTSRCTTPMRRARSSASATARVMRSASSSGSGPSRAMRSLSVSPSTNSMTTYGKPFDSPASSAAHDVRVVERGEHLRLGA